MGRVKELGKTNLRPKNHQFYMVHSSLKCHVDKGAICHFKKLTSTALVLVFKRR